MNDVTPTGSNYSDPSMREQTAFQKGQSSGSFAGFSQPPARQVQGSDDDPVLAGTRRTLTDLTSQVNRAYDELTQRSEQLRRREEAARERELRANETLAEAQRQAAQIVEHSRQQEAEA